MSERSAGAMTVAAPDPAAWLQAQGAMAADLATFQATQPTTKSLALADVLDAMAPAFKLGFAWSLKAGKDESILVLMHRGGWDMTTTVSFDANCDTVGQSLADLMGIRLIVEVVGTQPQAKDAEPTQVVAAFDNPPAELTPHFADEEPEPQEPALDQGEPMPAKDIATCLAMLKALPSDARKSFTIAFRSHFQVPSEARTIRSFITHAAHHQFIQSFIDELELQETAA